MSAMSRIETNGSTNSNTQYSQLSRAASHKHIVESAEEDGDEEEDQFMGNNL